MDDSSGSQQGSQWVSNKGQSIHHWPLRSVARKCGPASRISTRGREKWGDTGKAGVASMSSQSVYSATIERRTVMSSGFPPKTQMNSSGCLKEKSAKDMAQVSAGEASAHISVCLTCQCRVDKVKAASSKSGRIRSSSPTVLHNIILKS